MKISLASFVKTVVETAMKSSLDTSVLLKSIFFTKICLSTISCCGQSTDYELSKIFGSMATQSDDKELCVIFYRHFSGAVY